MSQNSATENMDLHQAIKLISSMNPHISLSDIAFLMDVPYESDPLLESDYNKLIELTGLEQV